MKRILIKILLIVSFPSILLSQKDVNIEVNINAKDNYLPGYLREGMYYISIEDFCKINSVTYKFDYKSRTIIINSSKSSYKIIARNPFIQKTDISTRGVSIIQLPTSTYFFDDMLYLPIKYSLKILEDISGKELKFYEPNRIILSDKKIVSKEEKTNAENISTKFDVVGISIDEKANGTMIKLKSNKRIPSYYSSFKDNVLSITFRKVNGDTSKINFQGTGGVVKQIKSNNVGNDLELKIFVGPEYTNSEVINSEIGNDIIITIHNKLFKRKEPAPKKEKWEFDVIVIDPGHGGKDPGAIGVNGAKEKDITLGIALKLGQIIKENFKDVKVVYTRKTDVFVDLYKRGKIANENNGKLFISIHCNSTPKKPSDASGFEVYLLRPGRTKEAIAIAEFENSVIKYEEDPNRYQKLTDENFILVSMAQSAYMRFSEKFAEMLHNQFSNHHTLSSRGVKQAGFYVLVGASMPNVLIETGYLSNRKDAEFLNSKRGQEEIAQKIFNAIKNYREHYELEMEAN
ncbi:MAG: N-acetylmuramoyl-L-alanine amidase [Ignavibacterium sp.]|nr:N-acetylmuramoyl-L-alanine amidase [Ignavibacterium sp.]